jgi:hypothetical protein
MSPTAKSCLTPLSHRACSSRDPSPNAVPLVLRYALPPGVVQPEDEPAGSHDASNRSSRAASERSIGIRLQERGRRPSPVGTRNTFQKKFERRRLSRPLLSRTSRGKAPIFNARQASQKRIVRYARSRGVSRSWMVCIVPSTRRREICAFVTGSRRTRPASTFDQASWGSIRPLRGLPALAQFYLLRRCSNTGTTAKPTPRRLRLTHSGLRPGSLRRSKMTCTR